MTPKLLAALLAAAVLPVAAQTATARVDTRPTTQDTRKQPAKCDASVTPKECARLAKSKNKQNKKIAKQKQDASKRPPAEAATPSASAP